MSKGNASCHIPNDDYRTNYDAIFGKPTPEWAETYRLRKQHQQICKSVSKRHAIQHSSKVSMPAHENAVEYRDVKTTVPHSLVNFTVRPSCGEPESDFSLSAYDMLIQEGLERN